jgi:hypothetical protein
MEPGFEVGLRLRFSLKRQDRRVASRQTPYFLSKRQQKVSKKSLRLAAGTPFAAVRRFLRTSVQLTAAELRIGEATARDGSSSQLFANRQRGLRTVVGGDWLDHGSNNLGLLRKPKMAEAPEP